jgi:transcriptional regulator with XRE-family HTH domain
VTRRTRLEQAEHIAAAESRLAAGETQREVAAALGVARSTLLEWCHEQPLEDAPAGLVAFARTPEGMSWLHRMVIAAHFSIRLRAAGGTRLVSEFLELSGLSAFVGVSDGAQHKLNSLKCIKMDTHFIWLFFKFLLVPMKSTRASPFFKSSRTTGRTGGGVSPWDTSSEVRRVERLRDQKPTATMRNDSRIPIRLPVSIPSVAPSPLSAQRGLQLTDSFSPMDILRATLLERRVLAPQPRKPVRALLFERSRRMQRLSVGSDPIERCSALFSFSGSQRA